MVYFFHHYELPVIVQQAQLQQMFMRSARTNNNNGQATGAANANGGGGNQQMNRENQQAPNEAPAAAAAAERPANNANNMFVIRGTYRRRVNHFVERLRNNFFNNVFGVNFIADNNNNNANNLQNQPGFNNLTRSLRMLNLLFPNRPILNVRIINVRSASAAATVADIMRTAEGNQIQNQGEVNQQAAGSAGGFPSVVRLESQENRNESEESSRGAPSELSDEQQLPLPPDPSSTNDVNTEPEYSIKLRETGDADVNNSVNVMQSSRDGDGESSQTTSSSNEQCWAWMRSDFFLWILIFSLAFFFSSTSFLLWASQKKCRKEIKNSSSYLSRSAKAISHCIVEICYLDVWKYFP